MLNSARRFHFLGICGTAMGSVAVALRDQGHLVTGSDDQIYPPMSTFLAKAGIPIRNGFSAANLPSDPALIVIGNAIFRGNPELEAVLDQRLHYLSLPEVLRENFLQGRQNLVVTGTHGKTTTSALLTWIFKCADLDPGFLVGGIVKDLGQGAAFPDSDYFVIEGDEYDTAFFDKRSKFLHYLPRVLLINNIEFDHADIFDSLEEIKLSFRRLVNIVPRSGFILINADDPACAEVVTRAYAQVKTVGFAESSDYQISAVEHTSNGSRFALNGQPFAIALVGEFNVRNAAIAAACALRHGLSVDVIQDALGQFQGIARRQEIRGEINGIKVIDDFGHHPTAIKQTLLALRARFPGSRLWAIFEPRSNTTRRAVFQESLPEAFSEADGVVIARVARLDQLPPGDRLNPEKVVAAIQATGKPAFCGGEVDEIAARMKSLARSGDVIVLFSNGSFGGLHEKLLRSLDRA